MPTRTLSQIIAPDGVSFLPVERCADHPAGRGRQEIPFLWAVGRVASPEGKRAVRELDLRIAALISNDLPVERFEGLALDYAAFVMAQAPEGKARLNGATLRHFLAGRNNQDTKAVS